MNEIVAGSTWKADWQALDAATGTSFISDGTINLCIKLHGGSSDGLYWCDTHQAWETEDPDDNTHDHATMSHEDHGLWLHSAGIPIPGDAESASIAIWRVEGSMVPYAGLHTVYPSERIRNDALLELLTNLVYQDSIRMGRGTGSSTYTDTLSDGQNPVRRASVRAFLYTDENTVDWANLKAKDITDNDGDYTLFLDPGKYEFSIEKNGTQITTITTTVV